MASHISNFVKSCFKYDFNKRGVTIVVSELRVELVLHTKPYVHSTTIIAHYKYDFG